jgi:hypothetical protein
MPSKSTYFYPKVPAGLIINKFKWGHKLWSIILIKM